MSKLFSSPVTHVTAKPTRCGWTAQARNEWNEVVAESKRLAPFERDQWARRALDVDELPKPTKFDETALCWRRR